MSILAPSSTTKNGGGCSLGKTGFYLMRGKIGATTESSCFHCSLAVEANRCDDEFFQPHRSERNATGFRSSVEAGDAAFLGLETSLMNAAKGVRYLFQGNQKEEN